MAIFEMDTICIHSLVKFYMKSFLQSAHEHNENTHSTPNI